MPLEEQRIDPRMYLGILLLRWKWLAICFLYSMLGGVLYLNLAPKEFRTSMKLLVYRDPLLQLPNAPAAAWATQTSHSYLLQSDKLRQRVAGELVDKWGKQMGHMARMALPVDIASVRTVGSMFEISVKCGTPAYGEAFLSRLVDEHIAEWQSIQMEASKSAGKMLDEELGRLEERIRKAEDDLIEYVRLNDLARVDARASIESRYLMSLMERKSSLGTELMLLEAQFPILKDATPNTVNQVAELTRETGALEPLALKERDQQAQKATPEVQLPKPKLPGEMVPDDAEVARNKERQASFNTLSVKLAGLRQKEKEAMALFKAEHPSLVSLRKQIAEVEAEIELQAQIELGRLKERYRALQTHMAALETAEYKWASKNVLASKREAELSRKKSVLTRYENNYDTLYSRLHDMRVAEELKAEHIRIAEPTRTDPNPVWPDPAKILFVALAIGLGGGFGLVVLAHVTDNKVQSITDVETGLKINFLGGVPYWVHSGLEKTVRPIVMEEHSAGAVEAYRGLRTSILSAMDRAKSKIVIVTSADSREGKTLTVLNVAILTSQMNSKVLLVDMDLRRGRLHRSLATDKGPGMADVLAGMQSFEQVIKKTRFENLDFVPYGGSVENASELLHGANLVQMFRPLQDKYAYIFIDTSPVLRVTDTAIIASQNLGPIAFVARANHTPKPMLRYALDTLHDANVLGLIMNSIEMHRISSLYYSYIYPNYSYYSNAYAYGYNSYDHYGEGGQGDTFRRRRHPAVRLLRGVKEWILRQAASN